MDKREVILQSALELFIEFGFHGTPTSKIALKAGVSNGTLFHYFKTKDELVEELYKEIKGHLNQFIFAGIEKKDPYEKLLKSIISYTLEWALLNRDRFYFIQQFHFSPHYSRIPLCLIMEETKFYLDMIEAGKSLGILKDLPAQYLLNVANGVILGIFQFADQQEEFDKASLIGQGANIIWDLFKN